MKNVFVLSALVALACVAPAAQEAPPMTLVSVQKIWDAGPHNAFTDLIRFQDRWFCTFRESAEHVGGDGAIRILVSEDGTAWESAALLTEEGIDLRDPKLCETPDGRLMAVMGGSVYKGKELLGRQPRVAFSKDGRAWSAPQRVLGEGDWLWRVTWHQGRAYGVTYRIPENSWEVVLVSSDNGVDFSPVTTFEISGKPNETTLRFLPDHTMMALVRREGEDRLAWFGKSAPPYTDWTWKDIGHQLGGPNFIVLPDGRLVAGGRDYGDPRSTRLGWLGPDGYTPVITLPSGGDTSYPGLDWHEGLLWVSYYSSHEGKTSIYLAKVKLP